MAIVSILASLVLSGAGSTHQEPQGDPVLGERLIEGLATADHLWVRGNEGAVVVFDRASGVRKTLATSGVIDLLRDDGRTIALRETSPDSYSIEDLETGQALSLPVGSDAAPLGLVRTDGGWSILTRETLISGNGDGWSTTPLSEPLGEFGVPSIAASTSGVIYVGFNQGEWGGGLRRIDPSTGEVREVRRVDDDPCDGPLAHECDPVTGLVADPLRSDCLLASVGLMHMIAHGRILRICGETVEVVYDQAVPPPADREVLALPHTWPFFGMAATGDGWIAVSAGKLFRSAGGEVRMSDMPSLEPWHGLDADFSIPALVILKTDVNWGMSVSGYTPLLVPVTP